MFYVVVLDVTKKELFGFTVSERTLYDAYTDGLLSENSEFYCELLDENGNYIEGNTIVKNKSRWLLEALYMFSSTCKSFHDFVFEMALIEVGMKQPRSKVR